MDPKDKDPKELYDPLPSTGNLFVILILPACPAYEGSVFCHSDPATCPTYEESVFCHSDPTPCPTREVDSPVEAGEVADEVRQKGGAPAEGVSKNIAFEAHSS